MKILAIDTATEACSAAVLSPQGMTTRYAELDRGHAEQILEMVDAVLAESGCRLKGLDAVAFGRGPGAFTGVRLAASVVQGLAFGADLRVVPVSDLRAVAQRAFDEVASLRSALVCSDARMHEVYWACYGRGPAGMAELLGEERVGTPDTVTLALGTPAPAGGVGRGFQAYPELQGRMADSLTVVCPQLLPRAHEIARLGLAELVAGHSVSAEEALPVYLRDDVARSPSRD